MVNFLAHIYLSFEDPQISLGNFFADHVKGKKFLVYPEKIGKGILLHRAIDAFTDAHQIHKQSSRRLHTNYRHYSRVIVDIFYDHFLAKNWKDYSDKPLTDFVADFYNLLQANHELLPAGTQRMLPYMIADNWLVGYGTLAGIAGVLQGMNRRTQYKSKMDLAITDLREHYTLFEKEFQLFFPELITFSRQKFEQLCAS